MNKVELVAAVRSKVKEKDIPSQAAACRIVDATIDAIMEAVASGDTVSLIGFGTFKGAARGARLGHNPQTGDPIEIPARVVPVFRAGAKFRKLVSDK